MAFSRVGTGRGPLQRSNASTDRPPLASSAGSRPSNTLPANSLPASHTDTAAADGPATTVFTQAIGAANALRRKQRRALKKLRGSATEAELERVVARNARQVGLGLRSGVWLPTNAIAKTSSTIDNQPREGPKRGARQRKKRSPGSSPVPPLDPIAAEVAAGGAARVIEDLLAANAAREQEYLDERRRDEAQFEKLAAGTEEDQAVLTAEVARLQSLLAETKLGKTREDEDASSRSAVMPNSGTSTPDGQQATPVSYRQQSSERLNTDAAHSARKQLRLDPLVNVAIDRVWLLVTGYGRSSRLDRETFVNFHIIVQKALDLDASFDVFDAERSAATEWQADMAGSSAAFVDDEDEAEGKHGEPTKRMSHHQFHDSLFELADIWTSEISAQAYAAFLWQLLQRISYVCIVFDDSVLDGLRTRELFSHDRRGASAWDKVRKDHLGQKFAARYSLKSLEEVLPWTKQPTKEMYTHPQLFKEVENQTQLLRAELIEDTTYLHGGNAVDTSQEILRSSSSSFSGLVSGTAVGWPFDGKSQPGSGAYATKQPTFEVATGRRVMDRFRDKKMKKNETRRRKLKNRHMAALCACQRCQAAGAVQRCWRGLLGRRRALRVRTERAAACAIQAWARTWLKRRCDAAIYIQRVWRGTRARDYVCSIENRPVTGTASLFGDDPVVSSCLADGLLEPAPQPEPQVKYNVSHQDSRLTPRYSHVETPTDLDCVDRLRVDAQDQLFLSGSSVAVQHAAAPLLNDLSAEALHREREQARQLRAQIAPVAMFKCVSIDGRETSHAQRLGLLRAQATSARGSRGSSCGESAGQVWVPSRSSSQRPTCDPQLLSKKLLRSRGSPRAGGAEAARLRFVQSQERDLRIVGRLRRRPTSAPSAHDHLDSTLQVPQSILRV